MRWAAPLLGLVVLAACGDDSRGDGDNGLPNAAPVTAPAIDTTVPGAGSTPPSVPTNEPSTEGSAPPPSRVSSMVTAPSTDAPASSAPSSVDATVVYASGDGGSPMAPVGWWDGTWHSGGWPGAADVVPPPPETVSIASVDLPDGPLRGVPAPAADYVCVDGPQLPSIEPSYALPESDHHGYRAIAVGASWDVAPRPVRAVGLDAPDYQEAGEALVPIDTGADPTQGDVTQVLRVDLDGDGIEEVLFTFERQTDPYGMGAAGDFSLVIARLPDATGDVVDQVLYSHVTPSGPLEFPMPDRAYVAAIADVNGDATMEVAISAIVWEGAGIEVFELSGGVLGSVMSTGCGV